MFFAPAGNNRKQVPTDGKGVRQMRQSEKETFSQGTNQRLFSVDFHDFLEKECMLNDVELSEAFHISVRDVQRLRRKAKR
jgi:hypothetical protein